MNHAKKKRELDWKLNHGVVTGVFLVCVFQFQYAQARGPSTTEERAKVVELARLLERDPLNENAAASRQWLRQWVIEVPDLRVYMCDDLLSQGLGDNYPYSREVKTQMMFSSAAFAIEHQDNARDEIAQYSAGIQGALRVYEVLLQSHPDAKSAFLDDLVAKRDHGELVDYIARLANKKCKRAHTDLFAALGGSGAAFVMALLVGWWFGGRQASRANAAGGARNADARIAAISQPIVFVCAAYYLAVGTALHFLEPEYDPRFRFMSEYVWGAYGWLMTTTFFVLGLAAFTVAVGVRHVHQPSPGARLGFGLLVVGALFVCLAGVFKEFIPHLAASAVAIPAIVMAALVLSWSFRHAAGWQTIYPATLLIALGMLAAFLSALMNVGMPGLVQRAFLCLFLLWLSIVVHRLVRVTTAAVV
jgi:hypothetical membrane protein